METASEMFGRLPQDGFALIECGELDSRRGGTDAPFILDIRRTEDWERERIPGSIHCEWANVGRLADSGDLPRERDIAVVCYVGQSSGQAAGMLRALGYRAYSLLDGFQGWKANGLTTEAASPITPNPKPDSKPNPNSKPS